MYLNVSGYHKGKHFGYHKDILSGYFIRIYIDIKGYDLDKYQWISHMDIREDMSWICLDIMWISWADIFSG